jgi:predicted RNase H-like HicB family nuclease
MFDVWYWAVLERNKDGRYFAHVPDLPGATASGATEREVLQNIAEIAADHVRDLVEDGHDVPKARRNDEIERDPDVNEVGRAAIPVDVPGKSVKISLSIDEALLKRIDRTAAKAGMTRSGFFAAAAEEKMRIVAVGPDFTRDVFAEFSRNVALNVRNMAPYPMGYVMPGMVPGADKMVHVVVSNKGGWDVMRGDTVVGHAPPHSRKARRGRSESKTS